MANSLTPEQDLIVREFYEKVACGDEGIFASTNVTQRQAKALCLSLLDYVVVNGKHVPADEWRKHTYRFGEGPGQEFKDTYDKDREKVYEAATADTHRDETDSGESTESAPLRKTLFRQDV